jgi:tRNA nucleotidyltransferase (CCA-adding enzyme)
VTLEQDLLRRDLTINAIAEDQHGNLIDPYNGQQDLHHGLLRHVSDAFVEDPLRVLRIARFNARFAAEGFHVEPSTETLLKQIVNSGELQYLTPERVWTETQKALKTDYPSSFFSVLHDCNALSVVFPEFADIFTDDNMATLQHACLLSSSITIRFASLCQFISVELTQTLTKRLKTATNIKQLAKAVSEWQHTYASLTALNAEQILALFNSLDVWRNPDRFDDFLLACQSNVNLKNAKNVNQQWCQLLLAAQGINTQQLTQQHSGKALGNAIEQARLNNINQFLTSIARHNKLP